MIASLLVPVLFLAVSALALGKKAGLYDCFTRGTERALSLARSLFPFLAATLILCELFQASGLSALLTKLLTPLFARLGIPAEIAPLLLIKPFSGSASTALLSDLLQRFGAESYIGRCACVCFGSSETVFYVSAVYFANRRKKGLRKPILIALTANFSAAVLGCFLCRFL